MQLPAIQPETLTRLQDEIVNLGRELVGAGIPYTNALQELRYALVAAALAHPSNPRHNQIRAAQRLGIHHNTVSRIAGELPARLRCDKAAYSETTSDIH